MYVMLTRCMGMKNKEGAEETTKKSPHDLENMIPSVLTHLPVTATTTISTSSNSTTALSSTSASTNRGIVSKRALSLLENIKTNPSRKNEKQKISLHRSHSLPNEAMLNSHQEDLISATNTTTTSASLLDEIRSKPSDISSSTSLTGFKKFQQIVQTANSKKKSGGEFLQTRRLYNELSNSSAPDIDGTECGVATSSHSTYSTPQPDPIPLPHSPSQASLPLPGSLFSVCTKQPGSIQRINSEPLGDSKKSKSPVPTSSLVDLTHHSTPFPQRGSYSPEQRNASILENSLPRSAESSVIPVANSSLVRQRSDSSLVTHLTEPDDYVLPSICFSLEERLASCTTTLCGSYILATFTSGTIRLYELLKSGNTDLEDRFGYILGMMSSSSNHSSLRIHTQCCGGLLTIPSSVQSSSSSSSPSSSGSILLYPSHIFIGARQGSTEFYVVDTLSVTKSRKKRGFLTMIDSQIQIYKKTDTRLRGFCSAIPIDISIVPCKLKPGNADCLVNYDPVNDVGYQCKYHILCGAAYGRYTIWEVVLAAVPSCSCLVGEHSHHDINFAYTEQWNVVFQGSTNGPSLLNGFLFSHYPSNLRWPVWFQSTSRSSPVPSTDRELVIELISQGLNKDARITQISPASSLSSLPEIELGSHLQILEDSLDDSLSSFHEFVKPQNSQNEKNFPALSHTVTPFRGVCNIHATSTDGMILFTGLDELVIYRLHRTSLREEPHLQGVEIYEKLTFSLNDFVDPNQLLKRRGRHFRQIEEIECTPDGQYALIRCSDVAVLLYSLVDIFGNGMGPVRTEVRAQTHLPSSAPVPYPSGYLTLCYQIPETYSLRISLSYVDNHQSLSNEVDLETWRAKYPHITHPSKVLVLTGWIPILSINSTQMTGVLRADRLCLLSSTPKSTPTSFNFLPGFIPSVISLPDVGLQQSRNESKNRENCSLCGCFIVNHWPDLILDTIPEKEDDTSYSRRGRAESTFEDQHAPETEGEFSIPASRKPLKRRSDPTKSISDPSSSSSTTTSGKRRRKSLFDDDEDVIESDGPIEDIDKGSKHPKPILQNRALSTPSKTSNNPSNSQMEEEILTLKSLLHEKEKECSTLIRKFDARLKIELNTRRNWKAQMAQLENKLSHQQKRAMEFEARAMEAERIVGLYRGAIGPLLDIYQSVETSSSSVNRRYVPREHDEVIIQPFWSENDTRPVSITNTSRLSSSILPPHPSHPSSSSLDNFCVVCQDNTADTIIHPCGHICLCYSHALSMQTDRILKVCPVCKQECQGITRVT